MKDFDWVAAGFDGCKLGHLLMQIGRFGGTHRAMSDVINLLHLLTYERDDTGTILAHVVKSAMRTGVEVLAVGAPYHKRQRLKEAGYTWDPVRKVWRTEVMPELADLEVAWLKDTILPPRAVPHMRQITWRERYR
jgi:DNA polymerase-3 subunit epsilon